MPLDKYCPIIVTEGDTFDSQGECWSVILSDIQVIDSFETISKIRYLSGKAPNNLFPGLKFLLYEGSKIVANGIVLEKHIENKNL